MAGKQRMKLTGYSKKIRTKNTKITISKTRTHMVIRVNKNENMCNKPGQNHKWKDYSGRPRSKSREVCDGNIKSHMTKITCINSHD